MAIGIIYGTGSGLSGVALMARVRGADGRLITRASISTIAYTVTNLTDAETAGTGTFTVSDTVFDALQQSDPRWTRDGEGNPGSDGSWGYNWAGVVPAVTFEAAAMTSAGIAACPPRYQIDVAFTPASGQPFRVSYVVSVGKVYA